MTDSNYFKPTDDSVWPMPRPDLEDILRQHGGVFSPLSTMAVASILAAYEALLRAPMRQVRAVRAAWRAAEQKRKEKP